MKAKSRGDTNKMQNDYSLIQMIDYKQVPFHKDPLLLRARANMGIYYIVLKYSSKNKRAKWNINPPYDLAEKPR